MINIETQTSSDEFEHDLPRDGHALMELRDLEVNDERPDLVGRSFLHIYVVGMGSSTEKQFVRPRKGTIGRVFPKVAEERLIAHLEASETNFVDSLRREWSRMIEDRREQSVLVRRRPADDNPIQRPVPLNAGILKNLRKVDPLLPTHLSARLNECNRLLSPWVPRHVPNRLIRHLLDIFSALGRAAAQKFNQARFELGLVGF